MHPGGGTGSTDARTPAGRDGGRAGAVDVLIIGGGANGTGLARDLAKRGVRVMLCDKGDLACGATGSSSGMIHGGARYLLTDTETTKHSCEDSGYIQRIVPHLLFRVPFLIPVPRRSALGRAGLLLHDAYFDVYDRYTPLKNGIPHARMNAEQLRRVEPGLHGDFLGAITTDEWGIDAARLCVLNALDARAHGAVIRPYVEVVGLLRHPETGAVLGARARRVGDSAVEEVRANAVVSCTGPWAEKVAKGAGGGVSLRPGKGVHLIYDKRFTDFAVVTRAVDGRQIFSMPYQNETWVGTTDDDYYGDLDDLWATQDEIHYLREALERVLPGLRGQRLIGTRVGVRNTIAKWGVMEDDLSRRYEVVDHARFGADGFYSLVGGKLASYRIQAEEAANVVCGRLGVRARCETHMHTLPGGDSPPSPAELSRSYGIDELAARRLVYRHGSLAPAVLEVGRDSPTGLRVVDPAEPTLECEIRYCLRHELVTHLGDLTARCRVAAGGGMGLRGALRSAQVFAEERGLDPIDERAQLMDMFARRWRSARPVLTGAQLAQAELLMTQYTGLWQLPTQRPYD